MDFTLSYRSNRLRRPDIMKQFFNHPIFRLCCLTVLIYVLVPKTVFGYTLCAAAIALTAGTFFFLNQKGFFADQKALHHKGDWLLSVTVALCLTLVLFQKHANRTVFAIVPLLVPAVHSLILCLNGLRSRFKTFQTAIWIGGALLPMVVSFFQFQFSSLGHTHGFILRSYSVMLVNITCVIVLYLLALACTKRFRIGMWLACLICSIWSIVNYYVVLYHGSPFFFSELRNIGTALQVLNGYSMVFSVSSVLLLGSSFFSIIIILWALPSVKFERKTEVGILLSTLAAALSVGCFWFFRTTDFFDWSWKEGISDNGYFLCLFQDAERMVKPYQAPKGYIPVEETVPTVQQNAADFYPDIIFILNESLSDLNDILGIESDSDYPQKFYSLADSVSGRAIVPSAGGGTNSSEFELLTSKSMAIMPAGAPFNYVDFRKSTSSIVTYLKQFGYYTTAMHCRSVTNYSRNKAYPAMGFDRVILGETEFHLQLYGSRLWLDEDNYQDLISYYEENIANNSAPQFLYLLTFQNHGGYDMNPAEFDTVHAKMDGTALNEQINEYLTSTAMSYQAFEKLTEYFSRQDRPVIICMVGDHTPSFIDELTSAVSDITGDAREVLERTVPYIVWSNLGIDFSRFSSCVSMVDLSPMVVASAGLYVTPFYQKILDLHSEFPIRTSIGIVGDSAGNLSRYDAGNEKYRALTEYYSLEYDSLVANAHYNPRFFLPQIIK